MEKASYLIIGAGVFGASTALHLIRKYPKADVVLVDREPFPCKLGASWDWNKVVRADYTDILYMKLAIEAKRVWQDDPLFSKWYHNDGMFWISDTDLGQQVIDLYKRLNANELYELSDTADAKKLYNSLFEDADYNGVSKVLINKSSGWAEARNVLKDTIQAAVDAGVKYIPDAISSLVFDDRASCIGAETISGNRLLANKVVLCTGAGTAKLLADSAPDREDLQVGNRMIAAAICTGLIRLSAEEAVRFQGPVCCQDVLPGRGGSIPPNPEREMKFWRDVPFKNTVKHSSGRLISMPPEQADFGQWDVPLPLKAEVGEVSNGVFGKLTKNYKIEEYRICWDCITPNEDFVVCEHPKCENLYIATAGSFHGWKFLPILGKYVVQMLDGELDQELQKTWAWDRDNGSAPYGDMWPKRELRDFISDILHL